jgi:hypothetical protein
MRILAAVFRSLLRLRFWLQRSLGGFSSSRIVTPSALPLRMTLDEGSGDDTQQFCEPSQEQAEVVACAARTTLMGSPRHALRWRRIGCSWTKIESEPNKDPFSG